VSHELLLLRHLKSSWDDPTLRDHERPLAPRGIKAGNALKAYLRDEDISPQLVLCSSATRAVQTWHAVQPGLPAEPEVIVTDDLYMASPDDILHRLNAVPETVETVMVVGHNPTMEQLAGALAADGDPDALDRMVRKYPTGGLARFAVPSSWRRLSWETARLDAFVVPRDLT
jgi:phosphohistidine phosphatase